MNRFKKFGKFAFIVAILAVVYSLPIKLRSSDWPAIGSGNFGTRHSLEKGVDENLTLAWKYTIQGNAPIASSPIVSNGILVFGARDGKIYAIDVNASNAAGSAKTAWGPFKVPGAITVDSSPVADGTRLYVVSREGKVFCLNLQTGAQIWSADLKGTILSSPIIDGNYLIIGVGLPAKAVVRMSKWTGLDVHTFNTDQPVYSSPIAVGGVVYIGDNSGKLWAINEATWKPVLGFGTNGYFLTQGTVGVASALYDNQSIYFAPGGNDLNLYQINPTTGYIMGLATIPGPSTTSKVSSMASSGNVLYLVGGNPEAYLFAFNETGLSTYVNAPSSPNWTYDIGTASNVAFTSSPLVVGNRIMVGSAGNMQFYVFGDNGATATQKGLFNLDGQVYSSPTVANGMVFIGTANGSLYAFQGTNKPPALPNIASFSPSNDQNVTTNLPPQITWDAAKDADGDVVSYEIRSRINADADVLDNAFMDTIVATNTYTFAKAFPPDSHIYYRIRAIDSNGAMSSWSQPASFWMGVPAGVPPNPPSNLVALPMDAAVMLQWSKSISLDTVGYGIWYKQSTVSTFTFAPQIYAGNVNSYTVSSLTDGTSYDFMLAAISVGGGVSSGLTATATPTASGIILADANGVAIDFPSTLASAFSGASPGNTVILGPGEFNIASTVVAQEGVSIKGLDPLHTIVKGIPGQATLLLSHNTSGKVGTISGILFNGGDVGVETNGATVNIYNNVFTGTGIAGVMVNSGSNANIVNNTFVDNLYDGVQGVNATMLVKNNIIIRNFGYGIDNVSMNITGGYNDLFGNTFGNWLSPVTLNGAISSDVKFNNETGLDFRECPRCATIDAGDPADSYSNEPQPNGFRINMGAFGNTKLATTSLRDRNIQSLSVDNGTISNFKVLTPLDHGDSPLSYTTIPAGVSAFPVGMIQMNIAVTAGYSNANLTVVLSTANITSLNWYIYDYVSGSLKAVPATSNGNNSWTIALTDGGLGDSDGLANGTITNLILGPALVSAAVPLLDPITNGATVVSTDKGVLSDLYQLDPNDPNNADIFAKPANQTSLPGGVNGFPVGMSHYRVTGLASADSANVTIVFPTSIPTSVVWLWYNTTTAQWNQVPAGSVTRIDDKTFTIKVTDGGFGDVDGVANGVIEDPVGPGTVLSAPSGGSSGGGSSSGSSSGGSVSGGGSSSSGGVSSSESSSSSSGGSVSGGGGGGSGCGALGLDAVLLLVFIGLIRPTRRLK